MNNSEVQRESIWFSGRVQGVGFRYTTLQVAREFDVAGDVMNLTDGRVLVRAEGQGIEIDAFVAAIQERLQGFIKNVERQKETGAPKFSGFAIR